MDLQTSQLEFIESLRLTDSPASAGLVIYKNNLSSVLVNTLKAIYPLTVKIVGEDFFNLLAENYFMQYPSRQSYLQHYGEYFSDFLKKFAPAAQLIYLPEVAQFEWACHQVFFAANLALQHTLSPEVLTADEAPKTLQLHPATRLLSSNTNISMYVIIVLFWNWVISFL